MPANFDLIITANALIHTAEFRLLDEHGSQLAYRQTDFKTITLSRRQGLFDLRNYLHHYITKGQEPAAVAEIGVCIAEEVLGKELFDKLWAPTSQRTLRILLPGADAGDNYLAAALARVPWEIARPAAGQSTLEERALLVRVVHSTDEPVNEPLKLDVGESLRALFVFAEARGSRPLGGRRERRQLRRLLEREVYPKRRVLAHVLSHGVTRERLEAQIQENNGYHIVHWSGHGHTNSLELAKPGGTRDDLSGRELLELFSAAGGFIPHVFFLSACHSGEIIQVKDWKDFLAAAQGEEAEAKDAQPSASQGLKVEQEPGYTGTAHSLLTGGVPCVVAMRYSVSDDYARELGVEFYRALLAHDQPKTVAAALTIARRAMRDPKKHQQARYATCDHATSVLYGTDRPSLTLPIGRSSALVTRNPRLHRIAELTTAQHEHFVGRTWELAGLGADVIGASHSTEAKPVAVITGLGGMGKTALVAEALALWEERFQWVLLYQAKPNALQFEATLGDIHMKLMGELGRYYQHVQSNPADAIHRAATTDFTGVTRWERLTSNLIRALRDEAILLVLDNLETNLKPYAEPASQAGDRAFQDPAWDDCIKRLAEELVGTPSRVLITSRHPLAAVSTSSHIVRLGPLPASEAVLYLREHTGLSSMVFGTDPEARELAKRLLTASRFHPLLMERLARLATGGSEWRPQLVQALETLERRGDTTNLPSLFETSRGDPRELAYLDDALARSIDQLIENAPADARRLLWIIALANGPVTVSMLQSMWSESDLFSGAVPSGKSARPDLESLLHYLLAVGLSTEEKSRDDDNPGITCHELVRERICARMQQRSEDRASSTENEIRIEYGKRLQYLFRELRAQDNLSAALNAGQQAIVYFVEAQAFDRVADFGLNVIIPGAPRLLSGLLPHLQVAAESAPQGRDGWRCNMILADALDNAGSADKSLPFFERAAAMAKTAAEAAGEAAGEIWQDYATIVGNWAIALRNVGDSSTSRELQLERAEALRKAHAPAVDIISSEVEILRLDIREGEAAQVLGEVEKRVAKMAEWWSRNRAGESVPEAPRREQLAHLYLNALHADREARFALEDWEGALRRTDEIVEVSTAVGHAENIATESRNRATLLTQLRRYPEAKATLEFCLEVFENDPVNLAHTRFALSTILDELGDMPQAIVQLRRALTTFDTMPNPEVRCACHNNLANMLNRSKPPATAEADLHRLAALVYGLVGTLGELLKSILANFVNQHSSFPAGAAPATPRLAELLADPAFQALNSWLRQRSVDTADLQSIIDRVLERVQQDRLNQK